MIDLSTTDAELGRSAKKQSTVWCNSLWTERPNAAGADRRSHVCFKPQTANPSQRRPAVGEGAPLVRWSEDAGGGRRAKRGGEEQFRGGGGEEPLAQFDDTVTTR